MGSSELRSRWCGRMAKVDTPLARAHARGPCDAHHNGKLQPEPVKLGIEYTRNASPVSA